MTRDDFRLRMDSFKKARESNPSLSYWSWKANKYLDGTGGITPYSASSLVDAIYQATSNEKYLGKPTHNYDFTISEEEANRLGYYPDERGHRDDRVKKVAHPTHPSRGNWKSFNQFDLTDFGMETPNYTLFGVNDGGQDPLAVLTYKRGIVIPEITVTPKGNYYLNSYDNIKRYADGTDEIINTTLPDRGVTNPKYQHDKWDSLDRAISVGDTVRMSPYEAQIFTENYKNYYPKFDKGTDSDGIEDARLFVLNWFNSRKQYDNPVVQRLLKEIELNHSLINRNVKSSDYNLLKYRENQAVNTANVTIQNGVIDNNPNVGGYYHPNYGIVLLQEELNNKNRASAIHEFSHILNTKTKSIKNIINNILYNLEIFDRGNTMNLYLTNPSEVHSRLMEFRKLNNLNPTKLITMPELLNIKKNGKDAILFDLYKNDNVILDLLNNVASNNLKTKNNIIKAANGTDLDGVQFQANSELTPEQQTALNQRMFLMRRMSGGISPVFDIQTVSDFTPIGNVTTAYDAYNSVVKGDYLTAGLIGAAALAPRPIVKAAKRIWHKIPEVNPKYFENKLTEFFDNLKKKKLTPNGLNAQIYQDAINQRNQIIEDLYTNPQYWERAEAIKRTYGDDYTKAYKDVLDVYENNYLGLPEPRAKDIDAKAEMAAKEDALKRYVQTGKTASLLDFDYNINPYLDLIDNPTTRHELSHYIDFNLALNSNPDFNNEMLKELKKDLSKNDNPLMPKNTDYFRKGTEQKSYMNTLRQFMYDKGLINNLGEKVTTRKIKEAIKLLPSQMNAVRAAYLLFKSPGLYTKWFNKIPLLGTTGATLYLTTEQEENKSN